MKLLLNWNMLVYCKIKVILVELQPVFCTKIGFWGQIDYFLQAFVVFGKKRWHDWQFQLVNSLFNPTFYENRVLGNASAKNFKNFEKEQFYLRQLIKVS